MKTAGVNRPSQALPVFDCLLPGTDDGILEIWGVGPGGRNWVTHNGLWGL